MEVRGTRVAARCTREEGGVIETQPDLNQLIINQDSGPTSFCFDWVFGSCTSQELLYQSVVAELVEDALQGQSCSLFAYGAKRSGKTYTLLGPIQSAPFQLPPSFWSNNDTGIIPRIGQHIFQRISSTDTKYNVFVSCMRLSAGTLSDLSVHPRERVNQVRLSENPPGQLVANGLQQIRVESLEEFYNCIQTITQHCKISDTLYGGLWSLSSFIYTITIEEGTERVGKLQIIDLFGSGQSVSEKRHSAQWDSLRQVVKALTTTSLDGKKKFVPYRNSPLTRLLKDALSGNIKSRMIAMVSPSNTVEDTLKTARFASRVMKIREFLQNNGNENGSAPNL